MNAVRLMVMGILVLLAAVVPLRAQDDTPGGQDHPLLSRMPGYFIENYDQKDFDRFEFEGKDAEPIPVEGRKTFINYRPREGAAVPSPLQIVRNYQNAITRVGGVVVSQYVDSVGGQTTLKLVRGTSEIWIKVGVGDSGQNYQLNIIEKAGMQQEIVASADIWKGDLHDTGHAAVYGIHFDTDKAEIKPGSEKSLEEIVRLLKQDPKLTLLVVGHTDSTGEIPHNMALSEARAKAVVAALTGTHGITAARLSAFGCGPLAPVASNDTDEGRAKNRRVELVKR
ncbi:MAG TPA: OmpA family protein [Acidobacteriota bacterium]|nr:OmpA family protein [Acidobacteriota bacterium]HQM62756.1 OmpA family protein [Acidobacteriota bacterium]